MTLFDAGSFKVEHKITVTSIFYFKKQRSHLFYVQFNFKSFIILPNKTMCDSTGLEYVHLSLTASKFESLGTQSEVQLSAVRDAS